MIELARVLERPLNSGLGNHLLKENYLPLHEGGLLQVEELIHLAGVLIRQQFVVGQTPLQSGVVKHLLAADQDIQLEDDLPLHRLKGLHHQGAFHPEEVMVVLSGDVLHCLQEE